MRSFITGIDSFIATHLAKVLRANGDEVFGLSRREGGARDGLIRFRGSIVDADVIARAIQETQPDRVFHLAAQSKIPYSFAHPQETVSVNVVGSLNLFEAVKPLADRVVVVSVGSSAEYGRTAMRVDFLTEDQPLDPTSPYGVSKVCQGMMGALYARVHGLKLMHVRPFAIIGVGKEGDALGDFCRGVVAIENGKADSLSTGNLSAIRDFMDVRDCVRALMLVAAQGKPGEVYNIGNGRAATLEDVMGLLKQWARRSLTLTLDPRRLRPSDDPRIVGNNQKLRHLGYVPQYSLEDTVRDVLAYWRDRQEHSAPAVVA